MFDSAVITPKCRMSTPYRDYFCLCRTLSPIRPYGAVDDPEATLTTTCGCIRLVDSRTRVAVVDPGCEQHRTAQSSTPAQP